jgi:hypothetical protein
MTEQIEAVCACGCGNPAPIASKTNAKKGHTKGLPLRFIPGHNSRVPGRGRAPYRPVVAKPGEGSWEPFAARRDRPAEPKAEPTPDLGPDTGPGWRIVRLPPKTASTKPAHVRERHRIMKRPEKGSTPFDEQALARTTRGGLNGATLEAPYGRRRPGGADPNDARPGKWDRDQQGW